LRILPAQEGGRDGVPDHQRENSIDGDPLANIEVLQDRDALRMIMKDGALHKAPPAR
jgi:hypothetical protein